MEKQRIAKMLLKCEDEFRTVLDILKVTESADIDFHLTAGGITVDVYDRAKNDMVLHTSFVVECAEEDNDG